MRRLFERGGFYLGCLLAASNLGLAVGLAAGWITAWALNPAFYVPFALALALLMGMTFQPFSGPWRAVLRPTPIVILGARVILSLAGVLFAASLLFVIYYPASPQGDLVGQVFITCLAFLMSAYAAVHWGVRPERVFGVRFLRSINPWTLTRRRRP